jgi:hypothetical protein
MSHASGSYLFFSTLGYRYLVLSIDTSTGLGDLGSDSPPTRPLSGIVYDDATGQISFGVATSPENVIDIFFEGNAVKEPNGTVALFIGTWKGIRQPVVHTAAANVAARVQPPSVLSVEGPWAAMRDSMVIESAKRLARER